MGSREPFTRRAFLQRTALGAVGAGLALEGGGRVLGQEAPAAPRLEKRGEMVYRRLGRTGLMVSELAIGGSPSPEPAIFAEALDRGMNLVDTSAGYAGGEERIGEVLEGRRDQVFISTKCHPYRMEDISAGVVAACETALGKLRTDRIDVWCIHGVGDPQWFLRDEVQAAYEQLKQQGKIRFAGVSCHMDPVRVLTPLIESGKLDVAILAFNVFSGSTVKPEDVKAGKVYDNWLADSGLQNVLDLAQQHDVGIIAMKTMAGGALQKPDAYQADGATLAQAKIKWTLSHPAVASALSEVLSYAILDENLGAVGKTLTPEDQALLRDHVRERSASVCRMCGRCLRACPAKLPIPDLLRCLTYRDEHRKPAYARQVYREVTSTGPLPDCGPCTACTQACPHGVAGPGKMGEARQVVSVKC
jgi:predicted aldo/keto reductase-like oxidoreductase